MTTTFCPLPDAAPVSSARKAYARATWRSRMAAAAVFGVLAAAALAPAQAQVSNPLGNVRNFPEAAQRGTLTILGVQEARLNSKDVRMAPGMRLFSPQNSLVQRHTVIGQTYKVNYVIEASTGMLHSAWILSEAEAAKPIKGSDAVTNNITTGNVLK